MLKSQIEKIENLKSSGEVMISYDEAFESTKKYFNGDELAAKVVINKYLLRDNAQNLREKNPEDMHWRIASEFARIEEEKYNITKYIDSEEEFEENFEHALSKEFIFKLLDRFKYIVPQGSPMYGIGNDYTYQSLGNCFTLGEHPYDSYGGILHADQMLVQLSKRRCGVGLSLDKIRPKGMPTKNAARTTDGIGVFMQRFSNSTREVAQSGRRGALLQGLSVHHPEIETFINIKRDLTKVTGSNISVVLTDDFMTAVKNDKEYEQRWPVDAEEGTAQFSRKVKARTVWNQIIEAAWVSAEPGLLFIDRARKLGLSHQYAIKDKRFADIITNPCGELWIGLDSCRLLLINLFSYVKNPFSKNSTFDYKLYNIHCQIAQRLMDDMVDLEIEKIDRIIKKIKSDKEPDNIKEVELSMWQDYKETAQLGRRTGLGITALGDCLAALNIKYGSDESIKVTDKIYKNLAISSMKSSCLMAKYLGAFPLYDKKLEKNNPFLENLFAASREVEILHNKYGRRNISPTTTAPAGTVSLCTQSTSGIESAFLLEYQRNVKVTGESGKVDFIDATGDKWEKHIVHHHHLKTWMDVTGETDIKKSPYWGATSNDIDWEKSVDIQAAAQRWVSHSISKTCNIPKNSSKELVSNIYMQAWEKGCKGFTVYRDGCRDGVLISLDTKKEEKINYTDSPKRPREINCDVHLVSKDKKQYFVLIGLLGDQVYEIFAGANNNNAIHRNIKKGKIIKRGRGKYKAIFDDESELSPLRAFLEPEYETITRLLSLSLRHGVRVEYLYNQLLKSEGNLQAFEKVIAKVLKNYIKDGTEVQGENCPDCGNNLIFTEGCRSCKCGFSKC